MIAYNRQHCWSMGERRRMVLKGAAFSFVNNLVLVTFTWFIMDAMRRADEQRALNEVKEKSQMETIDLLEKELIEVTSEVRLFT